MAIELLRFFSENNDLLLYSFLMLSNNRKAGNYS